MTGFGRAVLETDGKIVTVEIRTLNSKQLDLNTRIPLLFKNYENEIRSILSKELERAKADFTITFLGCEKTGWLKLTRLFASFAIILLLYV